MAKAVIVRVESERLVKAIEHYKGDLDTLIVDLIDEAMGDYESVLGCKDWGDKQRVYTRNGFRKYAKKKLQAWLKGDK